MANNSNREKPRKQVLTGVMIMIMTTVTIVTKETTTSEVLMVVNIKIKVIWDASRCSLVKV
jgi:hypothetical protein